ncbi:FAD-dependent monooxygenase [Kitasatospora sp. NBC_01302]|uniref:FAD-dependent monooxygenase n=1 Tax=Kitasatospora sp. NBC_01302 TaxID=2903575 RepID=UPI002E12174E|nr:FAD-dependent monooxygenase [Kitasatospora sp. NBC_01302]
MDTDVCVVGAGPAGLVLAMLLARSGVRVAVLEKSSARQRPFRGEILQPGALAILDELGVLAGARAQGYHEHTGFQVVEQGRVLLDIDYRALPGPYNHLLSVPQAHVLDELLRLCGEYEGFSYHEGVRVDGLLHDGDSVTGVTAGEHTVRAKVVVGADGQFSKVRRLAGIDAGRQESFDSDVLWFKLSGVDGAATSVRVFRAGANPALVYRSWPDKLQVGWTLPHGGYRELAARGIGHIRAELVRALPPYADLITEQVTSLKDVRLLDVFGGRAERWALDGLVLVGDAAHTHSPIGAQGINLAIQDAVLVHPILVEALRQSDFGVQRLSSFEHLRTPDVAKVLRMQAMQSKAMLSTGFAATRIRPKLAWVVKHTPLYHKVLDYVAYGNRSIRVDQSVSIR